MLSSILRRLSYDVPVWLTHRRVTILIVRGQVVSTATRNIPGRTLLPDYILNEFGDKQRVFVSRWPKINVGGGKLVEFGGADLTIVTFRDHDGDFVGDDFIHDLEEQNDVSDGQFRPPFESETFTRSSRIVRYYDHMAETLVPRMSKLAVFGFPASGKSTWVAKRLVSTGVNIIDTDHYNSVIGELSNQQRYHELAFYLTGAMSLETSNVVVTNYHEKLLNAYFRRMGCTLATVEVDHKEWLNRYAKRKDLQAMGLPFPFWHKGIPDNDWNYDIAVRDFYELDDAVSVNIGVIASPPVRGTTWKWVRNLTTSDPFRGFGHWVRRSVMWWCERNKRKYIGGGDEVESIIEAASILQPEMHLHYNIESPRPIVLDTMEPLVDYVPKDKPGDGRKKLVAIDSPLFVRYIKITIIYFGASPGPHLATLPHGKIIAVDPRPLSPAVLYPGTVEYHQKSINAVNWVDYIPKDGDYFIISDIRRDKEDKTPEQWSKEIAEDLNFQDSMIRRAITDPRCKGFSLKFRILEEQGITSVPATADIILQPYIWSDSYETRLQLHKEEYPDADFMATRDVTFDDYTRRVNRWNEERWKDPSLNTLQEQRLFYAGLIEKDLFELTSGENELFVSLWAISNKMNGDPLESIRRVEKKHKNYILLFPNQNIANLWPAGHLNTSRHRYELHQKVKNRWFEDNCLVPSRVAMTDSFVILLNDLIAILQHEKDGTYLPDKGYVYWYDRNHPLNNLWCAVVSKTMVPDYMYQTWWNSQTHLVRVISLPLRRIYSADDESLHLLRRAALKSLYPKSKTIVNPRVTGFVDGKWVAVSGHLMNLLVLSPMYLIDFVRYFDTVEENVRMHSTHGKQVAILKYLVGEELLAENNTKDTIYRLWHSYLDFEVAVAAAIMMMSVLRLKIDARALQYVMKRLRQIKAKYPKFNRMGWQAERFLSEGK